MNATQHYGPTHGYLDTHQQHLGHEGSTLAPTSYPTYHAPMMAVQGSYGPTPPSTGYYAYASTPTAMSSHTAQYGHHSLPSIPSLAGTFTFLEVL